MAEHFELPKNLTAELLIGLLMDRLNCQQIVQQHVLKTYYDSFDWRLYRQGMLCELVQPTQKYALQLINRKSSQIIATNAQAEIPRFCQQFEAGKVGQKLKPILEMRALLPLCQLHCVVYHLHVVNKEGQIVMEIHLEEYDQWGDRLTLLPIKGFSKTTQRIADMLLSLGLIAVDKPIALEALKQQNRKPKDYPPKWTSVLVPDMRADVAYKRLLSHLLHIIKVNEADTLANTDSEFLHDFRIAVRKTRVVLSQCKNVLPADIIARYKGFFAWLSQITGPTRDCDVYLLNFEHYQKQLPSDLRPHLAPFNDLLLAKQAQLQQDLAARLRSALYQIPLTEWECYLIAGPQTILAETDAHLSIKNLASQRIWKTYKKIIKQGNTIDPLSAPDALHDLRKTCKKLRYLMEFFQSFYPERHIDLLIKCLKRLQDVLGDFQDYATQQTTLQQFCQEMQILGPSEQTITAMEWLIEDFDVQKNKVREHFTWQFSAFKKSENHALFKALFNR